MVFLGEESKSTAVEHNSKPSSASKEVGDSPYGVATEKWMQQNNVSGEEFDRVYHLRPDGSFDIHDAPGRSKKEKTLNAYVLTGLGRFLTTNDREFEDSLARGFCETIGCYDPANHAAYMKAKGPEFSGDKKKGYSLTNVGVKRGAALVKEVAGGAK
jgi:hypothetical protein